MHCIAWSGMAWGGVFGVQIDKALLFSIERVLFASHQNAISFSVVMCILDPTTNSKT
jgi:hypothetical protein